MKPPISILIFVIINMLHFIAVASTNTYKSECTSSSSYMRIYDQTITYVDNLDSRLIPIIFKETYYSTLSTNNIKEKTMLEICLRDYIIYRYRYSRDAKDGFLSLNMRIMNYLAPLNYDFNKIKINYFYEGTKVSTSKLVRQFLKLKKRDIRRACIEYNEESNNVNVYVSKVGMKFEEFHIAY